MSTEWQITKWFVGEQCTLNANRLLDSTYSQTL